MTEFIDIKVVLVKRFVWMYIRSEFGLMMISTWKEEKVYWLGVEGWS